MSSYNHLGCSCCGGPFNGEKCPSCSSVGSENEFVYDPNPYSYNETPNFFNQPPQPQTYPCEFCGNNDHYGYDCPPQVPFIYNPEPCYNHDFDNDFPQSFLRETPKALLLAWENFFEIKHAFKEKQHQPEDIQELLHKLLKDLQIISEELADYINTPNWNCPAFYEDDDEEYTIAITPVLLTEEPDNSLSMGDEHLSTIPETESDELIKSSVENLVPIPSESEDFSDIKSKCDVPVCDNFITFSNPVFDDDDDFSTSDYKSFSDEDVPNKIYSNPIFDEEIISTKIDPHHFNAEFDLIKSLLNRDISIVSSPKIDSLLEEFSGELAHIDLIPPGINETDFDPEEEIRLVEKLLYDNSSPRPPDEFNSKNYDIESFSPSHIPVEDSDSLMEGIDLFLTLDDSMPPGIENDDYDSEGDILFLEELLNNDPLSLPENESFHFDRYYVSSSPRPPEKPPNDDDEPNTGVFTKVVDDISDNSTRELYVHGPNVILHFSESPMMINGGDSPILDVPFLHFYPP
ncbi:hypothetical protein Tco_1318782 [Tanacetum coccineum]